MGELIEQMGLPISIGDAGQAALKTIDERRKSGEIEWDGSKIIDKGVYRNVPIDTYHGDTSLFDGFSISSSGLRAVLKRPSEYWAFSPYNPKPFEKPDRSALEFGKAAHMLLLGEDGFKDRYVLRPEMIEDKPWQSNRTVCKQWLADQAKAGRIVITDTEIQHIRHMADALGKKEAVRLGLLNGRIERSIFVKIRGIWVKVRPDVLPNSSGDVVDLKTAASVDDDSLSKAVFAHGYHIQAGLMRMVMREVLGPESFTSFTFVFAEKAAPYDVRVLQLKDADIDLGERQAMKALEIVERCLREGRWPGYDGFDQEFGWVEMPGYARTRIATALEAA